MKCAEPEAEPEADDAPEIALNTDDVISFHQVISQTRKQFKRCQAERLADCFFDWFGSAVHYEQIKLKRVKLQVQKHWARLTLRCLSLADRECLRLQSLAALAALVKVGRRRQRSLLQTVRWGQMTSELLALHRQRMMLLEKYAHLGLFAKLEKQILALIKQSKTSKQQARRKHHREKQKAKKRADAATSATEFDAVELDMTTFFEDAWA
jgi:hypothetical protein